MFIRGNEFLKSFVPELSVEPVYQGNGHEKWGIFMFENGSGTFKFGLVGADEPELTFPSVLATLKDPRNEGEGYNCYIHKSHVGNEAFEKLYSRRFYGLYDLRRPIIDQGKWTSDLDWKNLEIFYRQILKDILRIDPKNSSVIMTSFHPMTEHRISKISSIMFEELGISSLCFIDSAVSTIVGSGRVDGVVFESGYHTTRSVCIEDLLPIRRSLRGMENFAGLAVTDSLISLLNSRGYENGLTRKNIRHLKEHRCFVQSKRNAEDGTKNVEDEDFVLLDGERIRIGNERFRAPEILFNTNLVKNHDQYFLRSIGVIYEGIQNMIDLSIRTRNYCGKFGDPLEYIPDEEINQWYNKIVISGGNTKFEGFCERLRDELNNIAPKSARVRISSLGNRENTAWEGGSILGSFLKYQNHWVTRKEYNEYGGFEGRGGRLMKFKNHLTLFQDEEGTVGRHLRRMGNGEKDRKERFEFVIHELFGDSKKNYKLSQGFRIIIENSKEIFVFGIHLLMLL